MAKYFGFSLFFLGFVGVVQAKQLDRSCFMAKELERQKPVSDKVIKNLECEEWATDSENLTDDEKFLDYAAKISLNVKSEDTFLWRTPEGRGKLLGTETYSFDDTLKPENQGKNEFTGKLHSSYFADTFTPDAAKVDENFKKLQSVWIDQYYVGRRDLDPNRGFGLENILTSAIVEVSKIKPDKNGIYNKIASTQLKMALTNLKHVMSLAKKQDGGPGKQNGFLIQHQKLINSALNRLRVAVNAASKLTLPDEKPEDYKNKKQNKKAMVELEQSLNGKIDNVKIKMAEERVGLSVEEGNLAAAKKLLRNGILESIYKEILVKSKDEVDDIDDPLYKESDRMSMFMRGFKNIEKVRSCKPYLKQRALLAELEAKCVESKVRELGVKTPIADCLQDVAAAPISKKEVAALEKFAFEIENRIGECKSDGCKQATMRMLDPDKSLMNKSVQNIVDSKKEVAHRLEIFKRRAIQDKKVLEVAKKNKKEAIVAKLEKNLQYYKNQTEIFELYAKQLSELQGKLENAQKGSYQDIQPLIKSE